MTSTSTPRGMALLVVSQLWSWLKYLRKYQKEGRDMFYRRTRTKDSWFVLESNFYFIAYVVVTWPNTWTAGNSFINFNCTFMFGANWQILTRWRTKLRCKHTAKQPHVGVAELLFDIFFFVFWFLVIVLCNVIFDGTFWTVFYLKKYSTVDLVQL